MGYELVYLCTLFLFSILFATYAFSSKGVFPEFSPDNSPIKIDMEIKRTNRFLKVSVFLKNLSSQDHLLDIRLWIFKKNQKNLAKIFQTKKIILQKDGIALPFVSEFSVSPSDFYEIHLQIFDKEGTLIYEKKIESEPIEV